MFPLNIPPNSIIMFTTIMNVSSWPVHLECFVHCPRMNAKEICFYYANALAKPLNILNFHSNRNPWQLKLAQISQLSFKWPWSKLHWIRILPRAPKWPEPALDAWAEILCVVTVYSASCGVLQRMSNWESPSKSASERNELEVEGHRQALQLMAVSNLA